VHNQLLKVTIDRAELAFSKVKVSAEVLLSYFEGQRDNYRQQAKSHESNVKKSLEKLQAIYQQESSSVFLQLSEGIKSSFKISRIEQKEASEAVKFMDIKVICEISSAVKKVESAAQSHQKNIKKLAVSYAKELLALQQLFQQYKQNQELTQHNISKSEDVCSFEIMLRSQSLKLIAKERTIGDLV